MDERIRSTMGEIEELLIKKNTRYGDAALNPKRIFSQADRLAALRVRIDDKLSRIANMGEMTEDEDTLLDLIGYLVLLRIALKEDSCS